ncbi:MAG TPA: protein kinase [Vicinamibacterales bacterium]|nr:protein kinase [Vicinamibacterales bacterium]
MTGDRWVHVKEIFNGALACPSEARSAFVDAACADDAELRDEVCRLLRAHESAGSFIDGLPIAQASVSEPLETLTGQTVHHYYVGRLIGAGGMGAVYEARDTALGRTVALKVVLRADEAAQARLRREAQHASQLNHPHICTIHEVGEFDGRAYIVMELVEGSRLDDLIAAGLPLDAALRYGIQVADALTYAHEQGIVHRDLKSANVVVTRQGRAKVLDFGLAERLNDGTLSELSLSRASLADAGRIAGTLPYIAPELLRGQSADARSDVWALGVLLYEMVAGLRPFAGATAFEMSSAILHEPPDALPARIPPSLGMVIRRCLAKEPSDRYQHAAEVRAALESVSIDAASNDVPADRSSARSTPARRRYIVVSIGVLFVALAASVGYWLRQGTTRPPSGIGASGRPAVAVMTFESLGDAADLAWLAHGVPSMLLTGLAQTPGLDVVSSERIDEILESLGQGSVEKLGRGQMLEVGRRSGAGALVAGSIFRVGSDIRIDVRVQDAASGRLVAAHSVRGADVFPLVDDLTGRIRRSLNVGADAPAPAVAAVTSSDLEAYRFYTEGRDALFNVRRGDARRLLEQAVRLDPSFALAIYYLSVATSREGDAAAAERYRQQLNPLLNRLPERLRLMTEADAAARAGNVDKSIKLLETLVTEYPDEELAYQRLAYTHIWTDIDRYMSTLRRGLAALPNSAFLRNDLGYGFLILGWYPEAFREFETNVKAAPNEPNPYDSLAEAYLVHGDGEKALETYARALALDASFSPSYKGRAWTFGTLGRYDEALSALAEENAIRRAAGLPVTDNVFRTAFALSRVGRYRHAEAQLAEGERLAARFQDPLVQANFQLLGAWLALERKNYVRTQQLVALAERTASAIPVFLPTQASRADVIMTALLLAGITELRAGRTDLAAVYLERQRQTYDPRSAYHRWLYRCLEGEHALALGRPLPAEAAFSRGEPPFNVPIGHWSNVFFNNLPFRDGRARAQAARGDLQGAIGSYRQLLTPHAGQKWTAVLEPRYVLELAQLLERTGNAAGAREQYRRFLELWRNADPDLPELYAARRKVGTGFAARDVPVRLFRGARAGGSYQTLVNTALREYVATKRKPLEATLRRVLREELPRVAGRGR